MWRTWSKTDGPSHSPGGTAATGIKKDGPMHSFGTSAASLIAGVQCAKYVGRWQCGVGAAVDGPVLDEMKEAGSRS